MARRRHFRLTPFDLYWSYPDADLLGMAPPDPLTAWDQFDATNCGDTLFLFLVRELGEDCEGLGEQIRRLDRAIHDLMAVRMSGVTCSYGEF